LAATGVDLAGSSQNIPDEPGGVLVLPEKSPSLEMEPVAWRIVADLANDVRYRGERGLQGGGAKGGSADDRFG
jgi:hypothetical protein